MNADCKEQWHTSVGPKSPETPRPPLAEDEVRFVGDPVALIVAVSHAAAEDAAELVDVEYEPLPPVVDYAQAEHADVLVHANHGSNVIGEINGLPVDALADVFASAAHVVRETIYQQAYAPAPMEGRALIVDASRATGDLTIYASTQSPHEVRLFCSRLLGMSEHRIRVVARDTGGGFGQKILVQREEMCVMLAAPKVDGPLKWVEERRENLLAAGQSRHEHGAVQMAFAADGAIEAAHIDFVSDCGAYPTPWPVGPAAAVGMLFPGPYRVPRAGFATKSVYTNTVGRTAYRGPWQFETLAREMLLDIAARRMHMDPIELRRKNVLRREDLPYANPNGMPYDNISPLETFEQALAILDYDAFRAEQAEARAAGRALGVGMSNYVEPSTPGYGSYATEAATIRVEPSGAVNVYVAGGSSGNSLETTVLQLTADALGVKLEDVHTIQGDTAVTGFGAGVAGSRSGSMTAGAIRETAKVLRDRIAAIAAHKLEAAADDIELADSRAFVRGTPAIGLSLRELAAIAYFEPATLAARDPGGAGSERALHRGRSDPVGERDACVHLRGRRADRRRDALALHRQRGLRPDDQPQRRRRADRGRRRAGHRRRAARAPGVRRRGQSTRDDLPRLPDPVGGRGAEHRVRTRRNAERGAGWLQGRGRRRRHRCAARGRQRGGRRARASRRDADAPAVDAGTNRRAHRRSEEMMVSYDPYDVEVNADPYPVFRRLREEMPLYYNEQYDFFAVSRYDDVERGLKDRETYISGRGGILELIKAGVEMPSGVLIFEDPPLHTVHRGLLSRVFTPKKMSALEPQIRAFCAASLDPLVGTGRFDFVDDLGAQMPMRVIGMLLGIPEEDQEAIRDQVDANLRTEAGKPMTSSPNDVLSGDMFGDYIDWRAEHPSDDLMTELLNAEFEDETGTTRRLSTRRDPHLRDGDRGCGQRDHDAPDRLGRQGAGRASRPAARARRRPGAHPERDRGAAALRTARAPRCPVRRARRRAVRPDSAGRQRHDVPRRVGEPRRPALPGRRPVRHPSQHGLASHVRLRYPLLFGRRAGPARGQGRAGRSPQTIPGVGARPRQREALTNLHRARLGDAPGLHVMTQREATPQRRRYDSPLRREQSVGDARAHHHGRCRAPARLRGLELARARRSAASPSSAGVNERTVYRYFANEHELRDAVLARLEHDSGVALEGLRLEDIRDHTKRILEYVSTFPLESRTPLDETLRNAHQRQRDALQAAVASPASAWSDVDRTVAAGMLDVLWSVASYERLVADWDIEPDDAIRGVTWVLGLVEEAIRDGRRPERATSQERGNR